MKQRIGTNAKLQERATSQEVKNENVQFKVEGTYCPSCKAFYYTSNQAQEMVDRANAAYLTQKVLKIEKKIR